MTLPACGGGPTAPTGTLIADFDLEGEEYLAVPDSPLERLCSIFRIPTANAMPDLGFESNCYPFNQFIGPRSVQKGLHVVVVAPDQAFVAQGFTNDTGRVSFTDISTGYLTLVVTGKDGNNYHIPVQVSESTRSYTRILVRRHLDTGNVLITAKTIHDADANGMNDDAFSYSLFDRSENRSDGGLIHLHLGDQTRIDTNGDGDFLDSGDISVIEPDDDGVKSDAGDGDENNNSLLDDVDPDIDGDGIPNENDPDIDGDGLLNDVDPYPTGVTPLDDFAPPRPIGAAVAYQGAQNVAQIGEGAVSVSFLKAIDDMYSPVTYIIYYSTTSPIDFKTASKQMFRPADPDAPDQILSDNVINLVTDQTYYFAVRVMDSAQPPNIDPNTIEVSITIKDWG